MMAGVDNSFLGKLDPNLNSQLMNAQQQLALARALQGQAMQPVTPVQPNAPISPLSVLGNALMAYKAPQKIEEANNKIGEIESKMGQQRLNMMASLLGGGAGGGAGAAQSDGTSPGAAAPAGGAPTAGSPGMAGVPDVTKDPVWRNYAFGEQLGLMPAGTADNYAKARYTAAAPTDQIKNDIVSGVSPAQRNAITTGFQLSPNQSNVRYGPDGQPILSMVGADPANNAQYGVANGVIGAAPVAGVANARAQLAGAEQGAKSANTITSVTGPGGEQVPVWAGPAATAGGQQLGLGPGEVPPWTGGQLPPQRIQQLQQAAARGDQNAQLVLDSYGSAQRPRLGQTQSDKLLTDQGNQLYSKINAEQTNNAQHRAVLNEMWQLAHEGKFGPGTSTMARIKALASNAGIDMTGAQSDQDVMKKLSSNMVMSQLGQGGTGTDSQLATLQSAFPNGEMTNTAMQKVIPMLVSQIDAREARSKAANTYLQSGGQLSGLSGFLNKFNANADPGTISLGRRMAEASRNGTVQQEVQNLQRSRPNDWQKLLQKVQQLDQMGAF
jgi:hypothetical protein